MNGEYPGIFNGPMGREDKNNDEKRKFLAGSPEETIAIIKSMGFTPEQARFEVERWKDDKDSTTLSDIDIRRLSKLVSYFEAQQRSKGSDYQKAA